MNIDTKLTGQNRIVTNKHGKTSIHSVDTPCLKLNLSAKLYLEHTNKTLLTSSLIYSTSSRIISVLHHVVSSTPIR